MPGLTHHESLESWGKTGGDRQRFLRHCASTLEQWRVGRDGGELSSKDERFFNPFDSPSSLLLFEIDGSVKCKVVHLSIVFCRRGIRSESGP